MRHLLCIGIVTLLILVLLPDAASAAADVGHVYVYNGGSGGYDGAAEGYCWQEAGFTNPDGSPMGKDGDGNLVDQGGNVVGQAIKRGGKTVGWKHKTNATAVVDINKGTVRDDAWPLVTNTGTLTIAKHGVTRTTGGYGGQIRLDNGTPYSGFGDGTGAPSSGGSYDLPARPGASITMDLFACWSGDDPDDTGPQKSVGESAGTVTGVDGSKTKSVKGMATFNMQPGWSSDKIPQDVTDDDVNKAIEEAFKKLPVSVRDSFGSYKDLVAALPFEQCIAWLRSNLSQVTVDGHSIPLDWDIDYTRQAPPGNYQTNNVPLDVQSGAGEVLSWLPYSGLGGGASLTMGTFLDTDIVPGWEALYLERLAVMPFSAPGGLDLCSGTYTLTAADGFLDGLSGGFTTSHHPLGASMQLYGLWPGTTEWVPFASSAGDPASFTISGDFSVEGLGRSDGDSFRVAAFGIITPEPTTMALLAVVGILGLGSGLRRRH